MSVPEIRKVLHISIYTGSLMPQADVGPKSYFNQYVCGKKHISCNVIFFIKVRKRSFIDPKV